MCEFEEREIGYCQDCSGSGEGSYDGSTCLTCGGTGEVYYNSEEED